jgi:nitroreductase
LDAFEMNEPPAALGLTSQQVERLLTTAGLAPSLHNSQPWRFRITPQVIELHADPERRLAVADPGGMEQRIACGAALFNLRLALHGHGIRPDVTVLPDRSSPDLIAAIRHGGAQGPTPEQTRLLKAVPLRHTNRRPFSDTAVTAEEQRALGRAALEEGSWLHIVSEPDERIQLQRLAARAHRLQIGDPAFVDELKRWTSDRPGRDDGVPADVGGPRPAPHDRWVKRDYTGGTGEERVPGKEFEGEPMIAVLGSHLSGATAEVQSGQALQHLLLTATAEGLAASFLSQIVEIPHIREELRTLIGAARPPQVVLRIGRGWSVPGTPRRAVSDELMTDSHAP